MKPFRLILLGACALSTATLHADFATWIASNSPSIDAGQQGESDDPDLDGVPSIIEYLVDGMNPGIPDVNLMPEPVASGSTLTYTVTKRAGIDGITTEIEIYDIGGDQWVASTNVTEDAATIVLTETIGSDAVLARLNVTTSGGVILNPIEAAYPSQIATDFQWTEDEFAWEQEFDVTSYGAVADGDFAASTGTDNWAAFNSAMAAASAWAATNGEAAIVRIPAGVYYIGESLMIPPGVVLRGDDPASGEELAVDLTNPDGSGANASFDPPSKLVFPKVTGLLTGSGSPVAGGSGVGYKRIYSDALAQFDASDTDPIDFAAHSRIGLVNLDINRAAIILDTATRNPIKDGGNWSGKSDSVFLPPFLTDSVGQYFIVYGIKSNNVAVADGADGVNSGVPNSSQNDWQRNPWRFNANIRVLSGGNALIANNQCNYLSSQNTWSWARVSDPFPLYVDDSYDQFGYLGQADNGTYYPLNSAGQATFRHTNQYGISLNGLFFFAKAGKEGAPADAWGNENGWYGSATSAPWLFRPGHQLVDNWIYSTIGGKVEASGSGLVFSRNVLRDATGKTAFLEAAGTKKPSNGSAFLSRGTLFGGENIVSNNNDIITTKHNIGNPETSSVTGFVSNDGEGMMIDNTTTPINGWTVDNNKVNSNIFGYKSKGIDNLVVTNNTWISPLPSISSTGNPFWFDANPTSVTSYPLTNSVIDGNTNIPGTVIFQGGTGSGNNQFTNNAAASGETANLATSSYYTDTSGNTNFTISYTPIP